MSVPCVLVLAFVLADGGVAETAVSGRQGGRALTFAGNLGTSFEGQLVALLGSCTSESGDLVATKANYEAALGGDHLRVSFAKPRRFAVVGEPATVDADEILVPISADELPKHIYVRSGDKYRAFAKYEYRMCQSIRESLESIPFRKNADRAALAGTWRPESAELAGQEFPEAVRKSIQLVMAGDTYTATVGQHVDKGTTKLNESAKPKELDITGTEGPNAGKTFLAIYELTGDTLRVCYDLSGQARPTEFKTKEGTQLFLVTYKREKK